MNDPQQNTILADTQIWLRDKMAGKGAGCPCCGRFAKYWKRAINAPMIRALALFYRHRGHKAEFIHYKTALENFKDIYVTDYGKLRFWGLLEPNLTKPDGKRTSGEWRITFKGKEFLKGRITVPKYILLFDDRCLGYEGPELSLGGAMRGQFDYDEMMYLQMGALQDDEIPDQMSLSL